MDEISAYKEEYPALYSREVFEEFGRRINIFAGGQKGIFFHSAPTACAPTTARFRRLRRV
jgi:hypothetical protein